MLAGKVVHGRCYFSESPLFSGPGGKSGGLTTLGGVGRGVPLDQMYMGAAGIGKVGVCCSHSTIPISCSIAHTILKQMCTNYM